MRVAPAPNWAADTHEAKPVSASTYCGFPSSTLLGIWPPSMNEQSANVNVKWSACGKMQEQDVIIDNYLHHWHAARPKLQGDDACLENEKAEIRVTVEKSNSIAR